MVIINISPNFRCADRNSTEMTTDMGGGNGKATVGRAIVEGSFENEREELIWEGIDAYMMCEGEIRLIVWKTALVDDWRIA